MIFRTFTACVRLRNHIGTFVRPLGAISMFNRVTTKNTKQPQPNKAIATKKLIVQEYKDRLKNNLKSLNDNFEHILNATKIGDDLGQKTNSTGRLADYYAIRNEILARALLMVKATDELQMLTNDIREFLILRDFNFISTSIEQAEEDYTKQLHMNERDSNRLRFAISSIITDADRELAENSLFRH